MENSTAIFVEFSTATDNREFCHARFIRCLRSLNVTFAMPCPRTGRIKRLLDGKTSSFTTMFEFRSTDSRVHEECQLVIRGANDRKKRKRQLLVYAVSSPVINHDTIVSFYKRRFGIETSYRLARKGLPFTRTRDLEVRFLYFSLAMLLENQWTSLHWRYFRHRGKGNHRPSLGRGRFTFRLMLQWIQNVYRQILTFRSFLPSIREVERYSPVRA